MNESSSSLASLYSESEDSVLEYQNKKYMLQITDEKSKNKKSRRRKDSKNSMTSIISKYSVENNSIDDSIDKFESSPLGGITKIA